MPIEKPKDVVEEATTELTDKLDLMTEDMSTEEQLMLYRNLRDACNERLDLSTDELIYADDDGDTDEEPKEG